MTTEKRKLNRRNFSYYMPVTDATTNRPLGIMTDISLGGFKLDSQEPVSNGQVNHFRLNLTTDIVPQAPLVFTGRSKWCHPDDIYPSSYNVGFELVNTAPGDTLIFQSVLERYGSQPNGSENNNFFLTRLNQINSYRK